MKKLMVIYAVATIIIATGTSVFGVEMNLDNLEWSVQYMVDQSQSVLGDSQLSGPRDNRGLAIDPTGRYLYAGYNSGGGGADYQVRKIDLTQSDYTAATVAHVTGRRGKAISVDDQGRVYLAETNYGGIFIYDADLGMQQLNISATKCEGVAVTRENGTLVLYSTDRSDDTLTRWELTESGGVVTAATKAGLDGDGVIDIAGASDLRGCAVDASGRIWMADADGEMVFRVDSDGTNLASATVSNPYAIAFCGDQALVTGGYSGTMISVLNDDLTLDKTLAAPLASLGLDSGSGSFAGIVVTDNGIYLSNEGGQTADEKSTYGVTDGESGWIGDQYYTDLTHDDNDPILYAASVPEPGTFAMLGLGTLSMLLIRRKRQA